MRQLLSIAIALAVAVAVGCAQGTSDDPSHADARVSSGFPDSRPGTPDAPFTSAPDAFVQQPADANIPPAADANTGGGGSGTDGANCNSDGDCATAQGYCCFDLGQPPGFCIQGDESTGICLPPL